ncbi:MAG: MotA/TolQ/ExbB proton channel family protein [Candidatus Helarchaeota archaeon]|nr:MotA/TolQ/ExbB proton channel family protein [Candidatus Helarchaeota archaeon]
MVEKFHEGGSFMWPILILLILGVSISIFKFLSLTWASVNTRKFLKRIKTALSEGGIDAATEVCANTRGPIASIFHAGLLRATRGLEHVEKAIVNAGTIEMAFLERGLIWLSTIIGIAPLLGFTGTVSGMIRAFESIAEANDISPSVVAGGISEALLTTLFGLIVAIIIQFFYNFFLSRIDHLVIDMEESSSDLVDSLTELETVK